MALLRLLWAGLGHRAGLWCLEEAAWGGTQSFCQYFPQPPLQLWSSLKNTDPQLPCFLVVELTFRSQCSHRPGRPPAMCCCCCCCCDLWFCCFVCFLLSFLYLSVKYPAVVGAFGSTNTVEASFDFHKGIIKERTFCLVLCDIMKQK